MFDLLRNGAHKKKGHKPGVPNLWVETYFVKTGKLGKYCFNVNFAAKDVPCHFAAHFHFRGKLDVNVCFSSLEIKPIKKYKMTKVFPFQILAVPLQKAPCCQAPRVQSWLLGVGPAEALTRATILSRLRLRLSSARRGPWGSHCRGTGGARWGTG